ncbi:esterase [Enterovibrio norvegicus]|uniref:hotdog fold thioesterase n=1 Tax=Enterovibrio norvegicus TaxID=188144 RepID=UPI000C85012F|nr:hotdog fold thioesterase [Enterovibrio norvegicus]MCC4798527.1 hotdog fold thioesterase [Enterovibrio norvegicus]PMI33786.1 esterase [Enterovibrio norvegicus]PMI39092.1 esterase [Enterovibrio norvegicus]PMN49547.1 esterase [Enterovibrio norvegicus]TKF19568.1 hotdog fold thioesterase [Enterovibrio norvegicus]
MSMWKKAISLDGLNATSKNTLVEHLGIQYTHFDDNSLTGTMPVDSRTHQPLGMLHGGASVVLAETLGSLAANMCVEENKYCVGLDINANHIRAMRSGFVTGVATPAHLGATTQVWQIEISDERGRLVCTSRLTMAVLQHKGK